MPGKSGFDFSGSSQSFNVLAAYLFGKVVIYFRTEPRLCIFKILLCCFWSLHLFIFLPYFERSYTYVLLFW